MPDWITSKICDNTVANPTSLHNVAFHWLTSEYMQLACGFMQLAAAGRIGATKYIFIVFFNSQGRSGLPCEFDADLW